MANKYAATHYGECQLCGHNQKLPGGGKLSLHGYSVKWNTFLGTCPGARHLPYEQSTDLLAGEIQRQKRIIGDYRDRVWAINASDNLWVQEEIPSPRYGYASTYKWRELTPAEYRVKEEVYGETSLFYLHWMQRDYGKGEKAKQEPSYHSDFRTEAALRAAVNGKLVGEINAEITRRKEYCVWLAERITKFVPRDLKPVAAEDIGSKKPAVHGALPGRKGRAFCVSSLRGTKYGIEDWSQVTCKQCLKQKAAYDARLAAKAAK